MLNDHYGRKITYLRISVTDRCNLRCVYCLPPEGVVWQPHQAMMRYEEIAEFVRMAAGEGIREVRLTGGEPLVRPDLPRLVGMLSAIPGIEDISLTTNGLLLEKFAVELAQAGLKRVNIYLDTLKPDLYSLLTRGGSFEKAWRGILEADRVGLNPIKINAVLLKGINDGELVDLARLTLNHSWHVRFIELMPIKNQESWGPQLPDPQSAFLSIDDALKYFEGMNLEPVTDTIGLGPAKEYRLPDSSGKIGFISPLSEEHFCQRCNRMRLTADGNLRPCLMSDLEIPILEAIRRGESTTELLRQAVAAKPVSHELDQQITPSGRCMMQIGG